MSYTVAAHVHNEVSRLVPRCRELRVPYHTYTSEPGRIAGSLECDLIGSKGSDSSPAAGRNNCSAATSELPSG